MDLNCTCMDRRYSGSMWHGYEWEDKQINKVMGVVLSNNVQSRPGSKRWKVIVFSPVVHVRPPVVVVMADVHPSILRGDRDGGTR